MDKKIKSSFTQKASDLCNDMDPVGGKIKQAIPPLLQGRKRSWRRSKFSTMIFLLLNWQLHLAPELDSFSDSPSLYPKYQPLLSSTCPYPQHIAISQHDIHNPGLSTAPVVLVQLCATLSSCPAAAQWAPCFLNPCLWLYRDKFCRSMTRPQLNCQVYSVLPCHFPQKVERGEGEAHKTLSQKLTPNVFILSQDWSSAICR